MDRHALAVLGLALLLAGCREAQIETSDRPADEESSTEQEVLEQEIPVLSPLNARPEVVGPGESIEISGDERLQGLVEIRGPDESSYETQMTDGRSSFTLPDSATDGIYTISIAINSRGDFAAGAFRVSSVPGIWLRSSNPYLREGQQATLYATAYQVPLTSEGFIEVAHPSGMFSSRLGNIRGDGQLWPLGFGGAVALSELIGQPLQLAASLSGRVRIVVPGEDLMDDTDPLFVSNAVKITHCEEASFLTGNLQEAGIIRAIWLDSGLRSSSANTEDGAFQLAAGPGIVFLTTQLTTDLPKNPNSPLVVRIGCGETIDVGKADEPIDQGPVPGEFLSGLVLDDMGAYSAVSEGELEFEHNGFADCSISGQQFAISFSSDADDPYVYYFELASFDGTGSYEGTFTLVDVFVGESAGSAQVEVEMGVLENLPVAAGVLHAEVEGEAGSATIDGTFSCIALGYSETSLNRRSVQTLSNISQSKLASILPILQAQSSEEPCRSGVIFHRGEVEYVVAHRLGIRLDNTVPRLETITLGEIKALLGFEAFRQLLGVGDPDLLYEIAGAMSADFLFTVALSQIGETYILQATAIRTEDAVVIARASARGERLVDVVYDQPDFYSDIAQAMIEADLCAEIEPEEKKLSSGEQEDIVFQVTDLAGEEVDSAEVTITESKCGELDPKEGQLETGTFETQYTSHDVDETCKDRLEFTATMQTANGEVETRAEEGTSNLEVTELWSLDMSADIGVGSDLIRVEWQGFFLVNESGDLVGQGIGFIEGDLPNYPCVVIDIDGGGQVREEPNPSNVHGTFFFNVDGGAKGEGEDASFHIIPAGAVGDISQTYGNKICAPIDVLDPFSGGLAALIAQDPTFGSGFDIAAKDGATLTLPIPGFNTTLTVTLTLQGPVSP